MKTLLLYSIFLCSLLGLAQAPAGYYDDANGLTGFELKTALKVITGEGFTSRTYGELLTLYVTSDNDEFYDANQEDTVLDMYSENPTGPDPYNYSFNQGGASASAEGQGTNREHLYPQGFFNSQDLMRNDAHHVVPSDIFVNSQRSNFPFGEVIDGPENGSTVLFISQNGSKLGNSVSPGFTGTVFEPIDEFKGDVARSMLYFATRYEDNWNDSGWDNFDTPNDPRGGPNKNQWYDFWFVNLLLKWHAQDPVSAREIDRNNEVFAHQNNRNPFIDNPQYVEMMYGSVQDFIGISATLNGVYADANNDEIINVGDEIRYTYAVTNAGNRTLNNIAITSNKGVFDMPSTLAVLDPNETNATFAGTLTYQITQTDVESDCKCVTNQFSFVANTEADNSGTSLNGLSDDPTVSANVDTDNDSFPDDITVTALPFPRDGGSNSNELFISEYIEGSSFNKAIEIANFTGTAVDLSAYSLQRDGNGGGNWSGGASLAGTLNDGEVYVVINNKAEEANILAQADLVITSTGSAVIDFNGDDPVGLFKNDVLIDIVGTFGVRTNFAQNTTLVRKPEVRGPNLTFDLAGEWNQFPQNNSDDLGRHTYSSTAGENDALLNSLNIFPNPSSGMFYINGLMEEMEISIYDVSGRSIKTNHKLAGNQFQIDGNGLYLVKLSTDSSTKTFKVIVK